MIFFEKKVLKDSIAINAPPEKIWDFFLNLEKNYLAWHPDDHIVCRGIKGNPLEVGSVFYFEEYLGGKLCKIKTLCTKVEKNKRFETKSFFPLSIFHTRGVYLLEKKGKQTVFTAINYFQIPRLFRRMFESLCKLDVTMKHMKEEGEILKGLMERM